MTVAYYANFIICLTKDEKFLDYILINLQKSLEF